MLSQRILSAAIMIPLAAFVAYAGGWWFFVALAIITCLATYEFYQLMRKDGNHPAEPLGILVALGLLFGARVPNKPLTAPVITAALLCSLVWHLVAFERGKTDKPSIDWAITIAGALYLGWTGSLFILLRDLPAGLQWIILACVPVWIGDSGAYFVGVRWGKHKCCPRLSPKKSWEGLIAGWITGTLSTVILGTMFGLPLLHSLILGILLSVLTPLGDFAESMFKRQVNVKDSSNLIPGHGGVLDRIDSLLFSVPIVYYFVFFMT